MTKQPEVVPAEEHASPAQFTPRMHQGIHDSWRAEPLRPSTWSLASWSGLEPEYIQVRVAPLVLSERAQEMMWGPIELER